MMKHLNDEMMKFDDNDNDELWIELCLKIIVIFSFLSKFPASTNLRVFQIHKQMIL